MPNKLIVSRGDSLTAALWNNFWKERRGSRLKAGPGVFLNETGDGTLISFRGNAASFIPHFMATLTGAQASFKLGLVNGLEPRIDDIPITGSDEKPIPSLPILDTEEMFDATGRSWLMLRVQVDDTGRIIQPDDAGVGPLEITIVQRKSALSADPEDSSIGFHPIAVLRRPASARTGLGTLKQIAMFDYQHRTARKNERWQHFFDPA